MATKATRTITDKEFEREFKRATAEGKRRDAADPRARGAWYDASQDRVVIELTNGATFSFPPAIAQGLRGASAEALAAVTVRPGGRALHWESLDADFTVPGLIAGLFGTKRWMAELGRAGGRASTDAKRTAARANGRKGGRPRKSPVLG